MKRLVLFCDGRSWHAAHFDEDGAPERRIVALFDTHILPLPWTAQAEPIRVLEDLKRGLGEFYEVMLGEPPGKEENHAKDRV